MLIRGALIREGRLVQNESKGGALNGGRRLLERGCLIEDLRYTVYVYIQHIFLWKTTVVHYY